MLAAELHFLDSQNAPHESLRFVKLEVLVAEITEALERCGALQAVGWAPLFVHGHGPEQKILGLGGPALTEVEEAEVAQSAGHFGGALRVGFLLGGEGAG